MKKYIDAKLQIVRMNNDIVTASNPNVGVNTSTPFTGGAGDIQAPDRRRIWD